MLCKAQKKMSLYLRNIRTVVRFQYSMLFNSMAVTRDQMGGHLSFFPGLLPLECAFEALFYWLHQRVPILCPATRQLQPTRSAYYASVYHSPCSHRSVVTTPLCTMAPAPMTPEFRSRFTRAVITHPVRIGRLARAAHPLHPAFTRNRAVGLLT